MVRRIENYDLSANNTFGLKARCACFLEYNAVSDLEELDLGTLPPPLFHVGEGSNLLFKGDFPGTILHSAIRYMNFRECSVDEVEARVGAGVIFDDFVAEACRRGFWGAENLSLIPGQVGASAVQNIGAYGVEVKDLISEVTAYDLVKRCEVTFCKEECHYAYRYSRFKVAPDKGRYIVTSVLFKLRRSAVPDLTYKGVKEALEGRNPQSPQEVRAAIICIRKEKLPMPSEMGSAGSFFQNPMVESSCLERLKRASGEEHVPCYVLPDDMVKVPAAWLIDRCALKGFQIGGAAVYEKQPLVIVNRTGHATASDVLAVETEVERRVKEKFGIELQREVEWV